MRRFACTVAALAALACSAPAGAQSILPFSVEGRGGLAFPSGDFGETLGLGYALGAHAIFNFLPFIGLYAGYSYHTFDFDEDALPGAGDEAYTLQGFDAGVRLSVPTPGIALGPYLRGGIVYYEPGVTGTDVDSDRELGYQAGVGIDYPLGIIVSLTPEVSYVTLPANRGPDANFIKVDFGLRFRL
ncbi:MAG TPA: outer membrane beta-barrel protein [Longimicrobiaceae bacterium]|nr:outer membrane beta-barrel protein [Longimicrobiaceae bacterium]